MDEKQIDGGQWAIVELMGHKVVAGLASKDERFGQPLLRVEVPATSRFPKFTQFYGLHTLYCLTPTSEEVACRIAEQVKLSPISIYAPDLVTQEEHNQEMQRMQERINTLQRALPGRYLPHDPLNDFDEEEEF